MELKPGQLVEHQYGYRGIILNSADNVLRICVFFHPDWAKGNGRRENWSFEDIDSRERKWFTVLQNAG